MPRKHKALAPRASVKFDAEDGNVYLEGSAIDVVECLVSWADITIADIADEIGADRATVRSCIKKLESANQLRREGTINSTRWITTPALRNAVDAYRS